LHPRRWFENEEPMRVTRDERERHPEATSVSEKRRVKWKEKKKKKKK
jgi:hypothetical protein